MTRDPKAVPGLLDALQAGRRIDAIQAFRNHFGTSVSEAIDAIDQLSELVETGGDEFEDVEVSVAFEPRPTPASNAQTVDLATDSDAIASLWSGLHGGVDERKQALQDARDQPDLRTALIDALFADPAPFLAEPKGKVAEDQVRAFCERQAVWQPACAERFDDPVAGFLVYRIDRQSQSWLHLDAEGLMAGSTVSTKNSIDDTLVKVRTWLDVSLPDYVKDYTSAGVWDLRGAALRMVSTSGYATVLYQGRLTPNGATLSSLSLFNGFERVDTKYERR